MSASGNRRQSLQVEESLDRQRYPRRRPRNRLGLLLCGTRSFRIRGRTWIGTAPLDLRRVHTP